MTDFKYRGFFIVSSSDRVAINSAIKGDLDTEGGENTFTNWASSNGNQPATHYYASSVLTESALNKISAIGNMYPNSRAWIWVDHPTGSQEILESVLGETDIVLEKITMSEALAEEGLQIPPQVADQG
jgi:hypothetical protein